MTQRRDTSLEACGRQRDALRRLDGPTRVQLAFEMSEAAREISRTGIRHRHPDWTHDQVRRALLELLLGPELARKVLVAQLTPT